MPITEQLASIRSELDKCMRCGFCMAVCPVYNVEHDEKAVARGKIAIAEAVLEGNLEIDDPDVKAAAFNCLVCKSCLQNCPTGVRFDRIVLALRAAIAQRQGLPWTKQVVFESLGQPTLMDTVMKAGAALGPIAFREDPRTNTVTPRSLFKILGQKAGLDADRTLPAPSDQPLRDRLPQTVPASGPTRFRVAFFTGCSFQYFYPTTGTDLVETLTTNGVEVIIPADQQCCGTPVLVHGDVDRARAMARANLDAIERSGAEYVVTGCGSCGGAFQHEFTDELRDDPVYAAKAAYWAARTYDVSTFLLKIAGMRPPTGEVNAVVTYHDSCHLEKSMKVFAEPREILRSIPGVMVHEMAQADACCGMGGSYALTHGDTARQIAARKGSNIAATGATTVATGCPSCMMQLGDTVQRSGGRQRVRHYISLLAEAYRQEKPDVHTL